ETCRHIEVGAYNLYMNKNGAFHYISHNIIFYLKAVSLGVGKKKEFLDGAYHVYDKNPYAFATENMHGDLPLIYVDFARRGKKGMDLKVPRSNAVKAARNFRFIRPADIIIKFPSLAVQEQIYEITIDVQRKGNKQIVVKSSCLLLSMPISASEITALIIRSENNLNMRVSLSPTNDLEPFNNTEFETALEIPFSGIQPETIAQQNLARDPYTIFLPKLTKAGSENKDNMLPVPGVDAEGSISKSNFDLSMAEGLSSEFRKRSDDDEGLLNVTMDARSSSRSPADTQSISPSMVQMLRLVQVKTLFRTSI
ncbi:hypothetical protein RRG08_041814, partial [Elysia crispata]